MMENVRPVRVIVVFFCKYDHRGLELGNATQSDRSAKQTSERSCPGQSQESEPRLRHRSPDAESLILSAHPDLLSTIFHHELDQEFPEGNAWDPGMHQIWGWGLSRGGADRWHPLSTLARGAKAWGQHVLSGLLHRSQHPWDSSHVCYTHIIRNTWVMAVPWGYHPHLSESSGRSAILPPSPHPQRACFPVLINKPQASPPCFKPQRAPPWYPPGLLCPLLLLRWL